MGIGRIFSMGATRGFFLNFFRGGAKSGEICFCHWTSRKQTFFAENFKIQSPPAPSFWRQWTVQHKMTGWRRRYHQRRVAPLYARGKTVAFYINFLRWRCKQLFSKSTPTLVVHHYLCWRYNPTLVVPTPLTVTPAQDNKWSDSLARGKATHTYDTIQMMIFYINCLKGFKQCGTKHESCNLIIIIGCAIVKIEDG